MTNDTRPPVAPVEGHYAMLRNDGVIGPLFVSLFDGTFYFPGNAKMFNWNKDGTSVEAGKEYDIIATISPEAMALAAVMADGIDIMQDGPTTTETVEPLPPEFGNVWGVAEGFAGAGVGAAATATLEPMHLGSIPIIDTNRLARLEALIPLADAACDYADAHCRAFPIATFPRERWFEAWNKETNSWQSIFLRQDTGMGVPASCFTHWRETAPPPSNPPLPAVFTQLGAALEKIKGAT